jgi:DNA ligase-1
MQMELQIAAKKIDAGADLSCPLPKEPMKAGVCWDMDRLSYPVLATPKIDGIRALTIPASDGVSKCRPVTRTYKDIRNRFVRQWMAQNLPAGLDGELVVVDDGGATLDFNALSGQLRAFDGEPDFRFLVFDYFGAGLEIPYESRVSILKAIRLPKHRVTAILPERIVNVEHMEACEEKMVNAGFEGVMVRSPKGKYKQGRSTEDEGLLLKIKRFADEEAWVVGCIEGSSNKNEAKADVFGRTARSNAASGKVATGNVGALVLMPHRYGNPTDEDIALVAKHLDNIDGLGEWKGVFKVSFAPIAAREGQVTIQDAGQLIGRLATFRHWPPFIDDAKPRFPQLMNWRDENEL